MRGGSLETVTESETWPTSRLKSMVRVWATERMTFSRTAVLKPVAEAEMRYVPGGRYGMR